MSIEAMRQARNAFVWNLNMDLDNIPACEKWAKMLRENIDNLDKALEQSTEQEPVGEVENEKGDVDWISFVPPTGTKLYTQPQEAAPTASKFAGWMDVEGNGIPVPVYTFKTVAAHGITGEKE